MNIRVLPTSEDLGRVAAADAAEYLRNRIRKMRMARITVATGTSQFEFLSHLVRESGIDWAKVTMFHLDEYIDLSPEHPASFRRYLYERFINQVHPGTTVLINGEADPQQECRRLSALITAAPIDAAFVGIGENGHLAFNDPPADFTTTEPFIVVQLDEASRRQQAGEGWFSSPESVPSRAVSMSIQQIMKAHKIFCMVPERRKAEAVRACLEEPVSPERPASILRSHPDAELYLDRQSASLLRTLAT